MLSEKEKLEEELRFLKESFGMGVVTKYEYEEGKQRIESELKELDKEKKGEVKELDDTKKEIKIEEIKEEIKPGEEPQLKEEEKPKEKKEEISKEEILKEEVKGVPKKETEELVEKEEKIVEEEKKEVQEKPLSEFEEEATGKQEAEDEIKIDKKVLAFIAAILVISLGSWYFFFTQKPDAVTDDMFSPIINEPALAACDSDDDCSMEGKIGICSNPGKENAECKFIEDIEIKLIVLNSKSCFNCQTERVMSILNSFYPNLDVENVEFETEKGKEIVANFSINALPAYIFDSKFVDAYNYYQFSSAFDEVNGNFVMKGTVANANYYFEREEIPNKLDLFLQEGQQASSKAEENLEEFLRAFDEVNFEKHDANAEIVKELNINTFPAFLVNNIVKFSGVQSADTIKENFCQLNDIEECSLDLSKSLV